jgi:hypothetical protein
VSQVRAKLSGEDGACVSERAGVVMARDEGRGQWNCVIESESRPLLVPFILSYHRRHPLTYRGHFSLKAWPFPSSSPAPTAS